MQIRPGDGQRRYRLTLSLRWDAAGWPVVGAAVTASIRHDADDRQTLVIRLNDDRDGNYSAVLTDRFGPGPYRLSLRATGLPPPFLVLFCFFYLWVSFFTSRTVYVLFIKREGSL